MNGDPNQIDARDAMSEAAADFEGEIHLLISDVVMPRMRGGHLARQLVATRPGMKVLFVSGYSEDESDSSELASHLLQKPFGNRELLTKVRELLDADAGHRGG